MENVDAIWQQLENPIPTCMEYVPEASVEMVKLQKENQLLTIALFGIALAAGGILIYFKFESKRKEFQRRT